jgi:selenium metabolism protein YedF
MDSPTQNTQGSRLLNEKQVDARGLACPQPVVLARQAILQPDTQMVRVLLDSDVSAENVGRMAASLGCQVQLERQGGEIQVTLSKAAETAQQPVACAQATAGRPRVVALVASDTFGSGEEQLGRILMRSFIKTLKDLDPRPEKVIFANAGVRLTTAGSDLIDDLRALESDGVEIVSCGTCLDYYHLLDKLQVGTASSMYEIASTLVQADRVVRP